jgi:hypothetical protein
MGLAETHVTEQPCLGSWLRDLEVEPETVRVAARLVELGHFHSCQLIGFSRHPTRPPTNHFAMVRDDAGRVKTPNGREMLSLWITRDGAGRYPSGLPIPHSGAKLSSKSGPSSLAESVIAWEPLGRLIV